MFDMLFTSPIETHTSTITETERLDERIRSITPTFSSYFDRWNCTIKDFETFNIEFPFKEEVIEECKEYSKSNSISPPDYTSFAKGLFMYLSLKDLNLIVPFSINFGGDLVTSECRRISDRKKRFSLKTLKFPFFCFSSGNEDVRRGSHIRLSTSQSYGLVTVFGTLTDWSILPYLDYYTTRVYASQAPLEPNDADLITSLGIILSTSTNSEYVHMKGDDDVCSIFI